MIELARKDDIIVISDLAKKTREYMQSMGLKQWIDGYPDYTHFLLDYKNKGLYVYKEGNKIIAAMALLPENDEAYKEIQWLKDKSMVMHRVLVDPEHQKSGIGRLLFTYAINLARINGYESIRVDTHPDNYKMQGLIKKMKFQDIGYLSGINRLAYELVL
ncbi:GNAT family N-acetyltransferase [Mycoplasmatota bacterium WC30]